MVMCSRKVFTASFTFEKLDGVETRVDTNGCTSQVQSQAWGFAETPVTWSASDLPWHNWTTNGTGSSASFVAPWAGEYTVSFAVASKDGNGNVLGTASAATNVTVYGVSLWPTNFVTCAGCTNAACATRFDASGGPFGSDYHWNVGGGTIISNLSSVARSNSSVWVVFSSPMATQVVEATYGPTSCSASSTGVVLKVELEASKNLLTLKHDRDCNLEVKTTPATGITVDEYRIDIKRTNSATWYVLSTNKTMTPWHGNIAGGFHLRGMAKIGGTECYSTNIVVVNQFPTYTQIEGDADVRTATDTEWANTLTDCTETPNQRRERGFWVRVNTASNAYEHDAVVTGDWVGPDDGASIGFPDRPADVPSPGTTNVTTYGYDKNGNRTALALPNNQTTTNQFDAMNRVTNMVHRVNGSTVYGVRYAYDMAGNRLQAIEDLPAQGVRTNSYLYDAQYRLTKESSQSAVLGTRLRNYTFDLAGNRLTMTHIVGTTTNVTVYACDGLNRLLSAVTGSTTITYSYDLNGNRTNKTDGVTATGYGYDTQNRLIAAVQGGVTNFVAGYDYRTRRQTKDEGTPTLFRYDSGDSFQEVANSTITVEFVRGSGLGGGIGSILYSERNSTKEFFTYDALGSTVALTLQSGAVQKSDLYEAFGNVVSSTGSSSNNRLSHTKERDSSIGLDNHGRRYFDPEVGRYINRDPIGYGDGLNVYLYVHNNPINQIDPLGLYAGVDDLSAAGIGAICGFGAQLVGDVVRSVAQGRVQVSSWEHYVSSTVAGAAAGEAAIYSGPVGAGAMYGLTASATRQTLLNITGKQQGVSLKSAAVETATGAAVGAAGEVVNNVLTRMASKEAQALVTEESQTLATKVAQGESQLVQKEAQAAARVEGQAAKIPQVGDPVTRNFGGKSDLYGPSWTTDPVQKQSRNSLGLPTSNSAELQAHGTVVNNTGMSVTEAKAIPKAGVAGGGGEVNVPSAASQIRVNAVTMPDKPLPASLPTDPKPIPTREPVR